MGTGNTITTPRTSRAVVVTGWLLVLGADAQAASGFTEVASQVGLSHRHAYDAGVEDQLTDLAGGAAAADYDRDGRVDVFLIGGDKPNRLWRNTAQGFVDVTAEVGLSFPDKRAAGPLFADFTGDGWPDLLVPSLVADGLRLFENLGGTRFQDITAASKLPQTRKVVSASADDIDGDSDLDVFLSRWDSEEDDLDQAQLWINDGSGTFTNQTDRLDSLTPPDFAFAANFTDFDGDTDRDLLLSADFKHSRVYINDGNGRFSQLGSGAISDENGMGGAVGDYDGDGDMDWFVSSIWDPDMGEEPPFVGWGTGNRLYRNAGGSLTDVTAVSGDIGEGYWGWGSCFADVDGDADLDVFHVNGFGGSNLGGDTTFENDPARLFVNQGDAGFIERAEALGIVDTSTGLGTGHGRGIVCFDYDRDGDVDLLVQNRSGPARLYRNDIVDSPQGLTIRLAQGGRNRHAIGARITLQDGTGPRIRDIRAGSHYASQDPAEAHFAVPAARYPVTVDVRWPDGTTTGYTVAEGGRHTLKGDLIAYHSFEP